jgi:hypothetical protein
LPSASDTISVGVELTLTASAAPTASDEATLKEQIASVIGVSEAHIRNFKVSSSLQRRHRRALLSSYTWSVLFDVEISLSELSEDDSVSDSSDFLSKVSADLEGGLADALESAGVPVSGLTVEVTDETTTESATDDDDGGGDNSGLLGSASTGILAGAGIGGLLVIVCVCALALRRRRGPKAAKKVVLERGTIALSFDDGLQGISSTFGGKDEGGSGGEFSIQMGSMANSGIRSANDSGFNPMHVDKTEHKEHGEHVPSVSPLERPRISERLSQVSSWVECLDQETGKRYYHNTQTNETSWDRPADMVHGPRRSILRSPTVGTWMEHSDPATGTSYYYNDQTGETAWERPETSAEDKGTWVECHDPVHGSYWYNETTGKTDWDFNI